MHLHYCLLFWTPSSIISFLIFGSRCAKLIYSKNVYVVKLFIVKLQVILLNDEENIAFVPCGCVGWWEKVHFCIYICYIYIYAPFTHVYVFNVNGHTNIIFCCFCWVGCFCCCRQHFFVITLLSGIRILWNENEYFKQPIYHYDNWFA